VKLTVVGGGPAGLYLALLVAKSGRHTVTVLERDGPDDTFGWGIVLSARTLEILQAQDPDSSRAIAAAAETWDRVDTVHRGERVEVRGNSFAGIARLHLLTLLRERCRALGVELRFHVTVTSPASLEGADLLVGADGAGSLVRQAWSPFLQPSIELRQNRYVWLGTPRRFEALSMIFRRAEAGLFIAHAYRYGPAASTFIVECPPETWGRAGLADLGEAETCAYLAEVFREDLDGAPLRANGPLRWLNFPLVRTRRWWHPGVVLLGDAAHTAHFSIGSGTKLALEDAIALAGAIARHAGPGPAALAEYEARRKPAVDRFQAAARRSLAWLEAVEPHLALPPVPFTYRLMTRSGRVGYRQLQAGDPAFVAAYDRWRAARPPAGPIPAEFLDLFEKAAHGHLATLMPDGSPQVTPVWVDWDGRHLLVNSARGRQKDLNMERRRRVAIEIADPEDPNRYLAIRGRVVEIVEEGADEHLDRLARRYLGRESYPPGWRFPGEVRRVYRILPEHVTPWNPFG
jgi:anthraniloyl-CoA monooxygenase